MFPFTQDLISFLCLIRILIFQLPQITVIVNYDGDQPRLQIYGSGSQQVQISVCTPDGALDGCPMKLLFRSLAASFAKWGVTTGIPLFLFCFFCILFLNRWSQSNYVPVSGQQQTSFAPTGLGQSTWLTGCFL